MQLPDRLLTRKQVAECLGVQPQTIAMWACRGRDCPPSIKIGRAIRYRASDVAAWVEARQFYPGKRSCSPDDV